MHKSKNDEVRSCYIHGVGRFSPGMSDSETTLYQLCFSDTNSVCARVWAKFAPAPPMFPGCLLCLPTHTPIEPGDEASMKVSLAGFRGSCMCVCLFFGVEKENEKQSYFKW